MSGYASVPKMIQGRQVAVVPTIAAPAVGTREAHVISFLNPTDLANGSNQTIEIKDQSAALAKSVVDTFDDGSIDPLWTVNEDSGYVRELAPGQIWLKANSLLLGVVGLDLFDDVFNTSFIYKTMLGDFSVECRMGVEGLYRGTTGLTDYEAGYFLVMPDADPTGLPGNLNWFAGRLVYDGSIPGPSLLREVLNTVNDVTTITQSEGHVSSETDGGIDEIIYWKIGRSGNDFTISYKLTAAAGWTAFDTQTRADLGATVRIGVALSGGISNQRPAHIVKLKTIGGDITDDFSDPALPGWTILNRVSTCDIFNGTGGQLWIMQDDGWDFARGMNFSAPRAWRSLAGTSWAVETKLYYDNVDFIVTAPPVVNSDSDVGFVAKDPMSNANVGIRWFRAGGLAFVNVLNTEIEHVIFQGPLVYPTSPIYLRLVRDGDVFSGYWKQNVGNEWSFIGAAYLGPGFPNPCNLTLLLAGESGFTAFWEPTEDPTSPLPRARWDDMQLAVYPITDKVASTAIISPAVEVTAINSVKALCALNGGSGSARIIYGPRGGGSPGSVTPPAALSDGETELVTIPLIGDYEWQVEITLASTTGAERPLVDCILSVYTPVPLP